MEALEKQLGDNAYLKRRYSKLLKSKSRTEETMNNKEKWQILERASSNERIQKRDDEIGKLRDDLDMKNQLLKNLMKERDGLLRQLKQN